jgi:hypothetical protein
MNLCGKKRKEFEWIYGLYSETAAKWRGFSEMIGLQSAFHLGLRRSFKASVKQLSSFFINIFGVYS